MGARVPEVGQVEEAGGSATGFEAEPIEAGTQTLVPGVKPIRLRDRLAFFSEAPLAPIRPQRPADFGLFDLNARNQMDLFTPPCSGANGMSERREDEWLELHGSAASMKKEQHQ